MLEKIKDANGVVDATTTLASAYKCIGGVVIIIGEEKFLIRIKNAKFLAAQIIEAI